MIYKRRSQLSGNQQERLIDLFVAGATARAAAEIVGVNRNSARVVYHLEFLLILLSLLRDIGNTAVSSFLPMGEGAR